MKPGIVAGIIVAVILGVGALAFLGTREDDKTTQSSNTTQTQQKTEDKPTTQANETNKQADTQQTGEEASDMAQGITMAEVGTHSTAEDCWTVINGSVYDITEYVPRHPGGEEILRACGADGTTLFTTRTTEDGEKVGTGQPHSSKAQNQLAQFKVGDLN